MTRHVCLNGRPFDHRSLDRTCFVCAPPTASGWVREHGLLPSEGAHASSCRVRVPSVVGTKPMCTFFPTLFEYNVNWAITFGDGTASSQIKRSCDCSLKDPFGIRLSHTRPLDVQNCSFGHIKMLIRIPGDDPSCIRTHEDNHLTT